MNQKILTTGHFVLLFNLIGTCYAATPLASGVIHFSGSIVEATCTHSRQLNIVKLSNCPQVVSDRDVYGQVVATVQGVGASNHQQASLKRVDANPLAAKKPEQSYALVTPTGHPIASGSYVITITNR